MKSLLQFLRKDNGAAAIELAFILPVLILLAFPVIDYARHILLQQRVVKGAYVVADALSIANPILNTTTQKDVNTDPLLLSLDDLQDLSNLSSNLVAPYVVPYGITISNIKKSGGKVTVTWTYTRPQSLGKNNGKLVRNPGTPANLPANLAAGLVDGDNLLRVTFTAHYSPITKMMAITKAVFLTDRDLNFTAYYAARYGDLSHVWPDKP